MLLKIDGYHVMVAEHGLDALNLQAGPTASRA